MTAFLSDGTIDLRPVRRADLSQLAAWRNDPELRSRTREVRPLTDVDQERWLERISGPDRRDFMFVMERHAQYVGRQSGPPIGVVGLCHWDPMNASAEVSFYLGDEQARGKGFASRAVLLACRWGFGALRLHRIWAEVYAFNDPSIRLLERSGFHREGTLREHVWRGGRFWDAHVYGWLHAESIPTGTVTSEDFDADEKDRRDKEP